MLRTVEKRNLVEFGRNKFVRVYNKYKAVDKIILNIYWRRNFLSRSNKKINRDVSIHSDENKNAKPSRFKLIIEREHTNEKARSVTKLISILYTSSPK